MILTTLPKYECVDCFEFSLAANVIYQVILEHVSRPVERRCPIARASNEVVALLAEHWSIFAPGCMSHFLFYPPKQVDNV